MPLELSEATEADAPRIGELWRQQFETSPRIRATFTNLDKLQQFIADILVDQMRECPGTFWVVVRDGQEICGFASWEVNVSAYEDVSSLDDDSDLSYSEVWSLESVSDERDVEQGQVQQDEARNDGVEGDAPEGGEYEQQRELDATNTNSLEHSTLGRVEVYDHPEDLSGWPLGTNTQLADLWSDMRQSALWKATFGKTSLWLLYLATDPRYYRRGVASKLLEWGTQICAQQSIPAFTISPFSTTSIFRKNGFKKVDKLTINLDTTGRTENLYEESCMLFEPMTLPKPKDLAYENDLVDDLAAFMVSDAVDFVGLQRHEKQSWYQELVAQG